MKSHHKIRIVLCAMLVTAFYLGALAAFADSEHKHDGAKKIDYSSAEEHPFGKAADPTRATRTITIDMSDEMRFSPDVIEVEVGEIVRFDIHNEGQLLHELVLGTTEGLKAHAEMMNIVVVPAAGSTTLPKKSPGMEHEKPHIAHVQPGEHGEIGWHFKNAGEFFYGCLVPGHYEAGMIGKIVVR